MAVSQSERRTLQDALVRTLGGEAADVLMDHLPPVGWADVATKSDLDQLRILTSSEIEQLRVSMETRLDQLDTSLDRLEDGVAQFRDAQSVQTTRLVTVMITLFGTYAAIVVAIGRFL